MEVKGEDEEKNELEQARSILRRYKLTINNVTLLDEPTKGVSKGQMAAESNKKSCAYRCLLILFF